MKTPGRKVLFIAYYFPPVAGGGVQRLAKFVKYLPAAGWLPVVLTVQILILGTAGLPRKTSVF